MKWLRCIVLILPLMFVWQPLAFAQNGAVIEREQILWGGVEFNGENVILLYASESEPCGGESGELIWIDVMYLLRPDGTIKYHDRAKFFARVYYPATWDDVGDDPCVLWADDTKLIAEGIANSTSNDNHLNAFDVPKNRRNVWGFNISGDLYDVGGFCSSGMVELNTIRRFMLDKDFPECLPDDCDDPVKIWKGPDISCY